MALYNGRHHDYRQIQFLQTDRQVQPKLVIFTLYLFIHLFSQFIINQQLFIFYKNLIYLFIFYSFIQLSNQTHLFIYSFVMYFLRKHVFIVNFFFIMIYKALLMIDVSSIGHLTIKLILCGFLAVIRYQLFDVIIDSKLDSFDRLSYQQPMILQNVCLNQ